MIVRLENVLIALAATPAPAQMADCTSEAQRIKRAQDELPKLEVAPPAGCDDHGDASPNMLRQDR